MLGSVIAPPPIDAAALVDPAKAARWRAALARFEKASVEEAEQLDDRFEALDEILTDELFLQGGFRSDTAFLAKHLPAMDHKTIDDHRIAARYFTAKHLRDFNVTNLAYLGRILERNNGGKRLPRGARIDPATSKVRVPVGRGKHESALFPTLNVQKLRAALRGAGEDDVKPNASPLVVATRAVVTRAGSHAGVTGSHAHVTLSRVEGALLQSVCRAIAADAKVKRAAAAAVRDTKKKKR